MKASKNWSNHMCVCVCGNQKKVKKSSDKIKFSGYCSFHLGGYKISVLSFNGILGNFNVSFYFDPLFPVRKILTEVCYIDLMKI